LPQIDGADEFRGIMLHSAEYRNVELVKGKKVVCIGFGESAGDIVAEMAGAAEECWVTFRRWPSLAMRWDDSGLSSDAFSIRASQKLPAKLRNVIARRQMAVAARSANPRVSLVAKWNLKCEHHMHKFLQKNDDFVPKVLDGTLKVHVGDIKRLTSHSVVFADGKEIEADMIVYCTGYSEGAPPDLIEGVSVTNVRDMFKHSIHPDLGERVAFIGWARPAQGGVPVCSEMQARYFSLLCSGEKRLPPPEDLRATIERDRRVEEDDYFIQSYMKTLVNYSVYLDAMAALIGCLPRFRDLWYRPALLMRFVFGTNIPSWYRLVGPHAEEALALENIRSMAMPFSVKRVIQFSWINLRLWLQSRVLGQELPYTLFN
jgi:dimethylaniline monooxygenase (N-oxide forming)